MGVHRPSSDAKSKLKDLKLFVKFQQRKRQQSNGSQPQQSKPYGRLSTIPKPNLARRTRNHTEANIDKFCNTREWVQIIAEETSVKYPAIQNVISLPGTFPRQRQTETHGQRTSPSLGSFLRQRQTKNPQEPVKWRFGCQHCQANNGIQQRTRA